MQVFFNKETSSNILIFASMVKKCLLTYSMMKCIIKMALVYAMVLFP